MNNEITAPRAGVGAAAGLAGRSRALWVQGFYSRQRLAIRAASILCSSFAPMRSQ